jgi:hypothetical protein
VHLVPSDEAVGKGCLAALGSVGRLLLVALVLPVCALILALLWDALP